MPTWTNATVTNDGYALQAKLLSTDKLVITRVVSGSGRAIAGQLVNQTDISDIQQTLIVESVSYDDKGNALLRILLNNKGLTASYICNQIGIYANDPDKGEILYAIAQETTGTHNIPSITEQPYGYDCGWVFVLTFSNSESISVTIDPSNVLTVEAGDERYLEKENAVGKLLEGQTVEVTYEETVTAGVGAEIFNDYRKRTYLNVSGAALTGNVASGAYSHAEGTRTTARGAQSHAEGYSTHASGNQSHAEGYSTRASGDYSHAEGFGTQASGAQSHAEGFGTQASGDSSHAGGYFTVADNYQFVTGKYNTEKSGPTHENDQSADNSIFIIGNGTTEASSNAMRVTAAGRCMGVSAFLSSGADFAEYFEWLDGNPNNEDRRGRFVTLDGKKIKLANADDDYILGAISVKGAFIGNSASENWHGMYLTDVFGEPLTKQVEVPENVDEKTGKTIAAHTITRFVINPEYNPEQEYVSREFRKEYAPVGFHGQIVVVDDGTCQVNSYCKPSANGIATASESGYRVMNRLDDTHIEVLIK